jgi:ribonuclease Z
MNRLYVLGSGAALPDAQRDTTALALQVGRSLTLIEAGGSTLHRIQRLGFTLDQIDRVILTHGHPDHSYGLPAILLGLWLAGRTQPLPVYAPQHGLDRLQKVVTLFGMDEWPDVYPVQYRTIVLDEFTPVLETADLRILASPGQHVVPVVGVRIELRQPPYAVVFTGDTEPADSIVRLAEGADLLIHESTALEGRLTGHTSAAEAGEVARRAGARQLMLIHLPPMTTEEERVMQDRAADAFGKPVALAADNLVITLVP